MIVSNIKISKDSRAGSPKNEDEMQDDGEKDDGITYGATQDIHIQLRCRRCPKAAIASATSERGHML